MKKVFLSFLCFLSMFAYAQNGNSFHVPGNYNKKGELPPAWLKNKVSAAQYDTLVMLNKFFNVDYAGFKGCRLSKELIARRMSDIRVAVDEVSKEKAPDVPVRLYGSLLNIGTGLKPLRLTVNGATVATDYLVYSSPDGYDAHVLLTASFQPEADGQYASKSYTVEGCSLSKIPLKTDLKLRKMHSDAPPAGLEINKGGGSPTYSLTGTIEFDDPLGYHHKEFVDKMFVLSL